MALPSIPGITLTKGVAMNQPPATLLESISKQVKEAVDTLPPGSNGAIVGVATTTGINLAVVSKLGEHVTIVGWAGRSWGQPMDKGAAVQVYW